MIIFKESTHSILGDLPALLEDKGDLLMGLVGTYGATELFTKYLNKENLNSLYGSLPKSIKDKIDSGKPLTPSEEYQEMQIAQRSCNIRFRSGTPGHESLQAINEYYRETNPVASIGRGRYEEE